MKNENATKLNGVLTILKHYTGPRHVAVIFYFPHMQTLKVIEGSKFKEESTTDSKINPEEDIPTPTGREWNYNMTLEGSRILKLQRRFRDVYSA